MSIPLPTVTRARFLQLHTISLTFCQQHELPLFSGYVMFKGDTPCGFAPQTDILDAIGWDKGIVALSSIYQDEAWLSEGLNELGIAVWHKIRIQEEERNNLPGWPHDINVQACIDLLESTPDGQRAVGDLFTGLLQWGEAVSEEGRGEQAEAFCKLVVHAILYGDYETVANALKETMRKGHSNYQAQMKDRQFIVEHGTATIRHPADEKPGTVEASAS